jgi:hypothetical protein
MAHQLLAVYTNYEARVFGNPARCIFCGRPVYPSQQADKNHESGYLAIVDNREAIMHGTCDPDK